MFGISPMQLVIILVIVVLLFGTKKLRGDLHSWNILRSMHLCNSVGSSLMADRPGGLFTLCWCFGHWRLQTWDIA